MSQFNWKLTEKTYQTETYECEFKFKNRMLKAHIHMQYHTTLKYWHVSYKWLYKKNMLTNTLKWYDNRTHGENRTGIRMIANQWMKEASIGDWKDIEPFYQKQIIGEEE